MDPEIKIKQKKLNSEYQKMLVNILFTGSWLERNSSRFLKQYGISPQQYNILTILQAQHPLPASVNLLTERMLDKMSNASRLVEKLRMKSLVDRRTSGADRRAVEVLITKKGHRLLAVIDAARKEMKGTFAGISVKDARMVNQVLDKLRKKS